MLYLDLHFLYLEENQVLMSKQEELKIERGQLVSYSKCEIVNVFYIALPKTEDFRLHTSIKWVPLLPCVRGFGNHHSLRTTCLEP